MNTINGITIPNPVVREPDELLATWYPAITYSKWDMLFYNGAFYESKQAANLNKNPATETAWWRPFINEPIGKPFPWFDTSPPDGCLELDGSQVGIAAYLRYFNAVNVYSIGLVDEVPTMTSATTPSGEVFGIGDSAPYLVFDDNNATELIALGETTGWVAYEFTAAKTVGAFTVTATTTVNRTPKDFTLQGSNNSTTGSDGDWTVLATITGETSWGSNEKRRFKVSTPASYTMYKVVTTDNNGGADMSIAEVEFCEDMIIPDFQTGGGRVIRAYDPASGRTIGDYQADAVKNHAHNMTVQVYNGASNNAHGYFGGHDFSLKASGVNINITSWATVSGEAENRIKNLSALMVARY